MFTKKMLLTVLAASAVLLALGIGSQLIGGAHAQPPVGMGEPTPLGVTIPYPGRLTDDAGQPVTDGVYDFSFALYDVETAGIPLWSEVQKGLAVQDSAFGVSLGSVRAIPSTALDDQDRWLAVAVRGPGETDFTPLTPRQRLSASAPENRATTDQAAATQGLACPHDHFGESWSGDGTGLVLHSYYDEGLLAISDRPGEGVGVHGEGTLYGVYGEATTSTANAAGVYGWASSTTGNVKGVVGETWSTNSGVATVGVSHGNRHAGWFETGNYVSLGVFNNSTGNATLQVSNSAAAPRPAAQFWGDVTIYGNLSKSGGGFQIDHPLDPENQYLNHSFVESPERMNVYSGNVVLDTNGEAVVELPDYFEALNQDFRYQLTPIGAPAPNLYVAEEIAGNRFKIAGGPAGLKVSWQVTGVRQDPWAQANPLLVEEPKPAEERGSYAHPEVYDQPDSVNVRWIHVPQEMMMLE
ncbi:MAG: hypothetical protein KKA73_19505 [Chloroflexi bacterium]|nr:hypothetical protein [Chloroflexota bacterium]MBU1749874.1 hypothetical protein [Chloroflexota bacterium]